MNYFKITDDAKLKTSEILAECKKQFDVWSYCDDEQLDKDFPKPKSPTTRHFKYNIEADEDLKNLSAGDLKEKGIEGVTLRERLLMELQYFKDTGDHLDKDNITLCSGSRYSDGCVPGVRWGVGRRGLCVGWCFAATRYDRLRSRAAVSLDTSEPIVPLGLEQAIKVVKEAGYKVIKEI